MVIKLEITEGNVVAEIMQSPMDPNYYLMMAGENNLKGALERVQRISRQRGETLTLEYDEVKVLVNAESDISQLVAAHEAAPRPQPMSEVGP